MQPSWVVDTTHYLAASAKAAGNAAQLWVEMARHRSSIAMMRHARTYCALLHQLPLLPLLLLLLHAAASAAATAATAATAAHCCISCCHPMQPPRLHPVETPCDFSSM